MKKQDQEEKRTDRFRSLCSMSGLLLSVVCCIALIHVELRIQEHHRLISHSVTTCDQLETQILRKVQQNYEIWQDDKGGHSQGQWRETRGKFGSCCWHFKNILISQCTGVLRDSGAYFQLDVGGGRGGGLENERQGREFVGGSGAILPQKVSVSFCIRL